MAIFIAIAGFEYEGSNPIGVFDNLADCQAYIEKDIAEVVAKNGEIMGEEWKLQIWELGGTKVLAGYWIEVEPDGTIEWHYWDEKLSKIQLTERLAEVDKNS